MRDSASKVSATMTLCSAKESAAALLWRVWLGFFGFSAGNVLLLGVTSVRDSATIASAPGLLPAMGKPMLMLCASSDYDGTSRRR